MKKIIYIFIALSVASAVFYSCKKNPDYKIISTPVALDASPISDVGCLGTGTSTVAIKGTMLAGKTYTVCGNLLVDVKDTLIIQEGVTINFTGNYGLGVKGTLICLGTKDKPNLITYAGVTKTDQIGADPSKDPAFAGKWTGIIGGPTCKLMVIKWTHIEFGGGAPSDAIAALSKSPYPVFFQNPGGVFVLEDSWLYGSVDDPFRILGGKIAVMRNTFEKCGYTGGEAMNAKSGTIGDFAYNLCIGIATNGPKLSNSGAAVGVPGSNVRMYNNTIINCGYRRAAAGRGGSINYEEGAGGLAYNNLIVNCKFGLRVVQNPIADTANLRYGYNFYYADSIAVASQNYPSLSVSTAFPKAPLTDIPSPDSYLPAGWKAGDVYTAPQSVIGINNPRFVNGPVPLPAGVKLKDIATVGSYNFALLPTSPCIGKGYTGFAPRKDVPIDSKFGATEITPPGRDIGAYQSDRSGNQHF
ncbi:right-handed parallel beta-helix repeat-containing protein [Mucilaginibacter sp. HMF5004]|uniref:right-handed parallel beta-helix repeat-containing protein n=1 Tax=Mucilaginibacter rivuli TaxID=2857527 RepID=UPI001C5E26F5|nr:right-handed parallel beta-helix repeat-containing protein [Mucilaginibacter rivuli]MBW4888217.1 right-handed parallel beta-helix repeat-containing protein [Mucilaginibacter rivuli]